MFQLKSDKNLLFTSRTVMGQDELVLRVTPDPTTSTPGLKRDGKPDLGTMSSSSNGHRSHSRESSGASNLSVKFTVQNDGSASPKASVTTPYHYDGSVKPVTSCLRKNQDLSMRRERHKRRPLTTPRRSDEKSEESLYEDSDDSLNLNNDQDRLSPESVDETAPNGRR